MSVFLLQHAQRIFGETEQKDRPGVLPAPLRGGTSGGRGAARAPRRPGALTDADAHLRGLGSGPGAELQVRQPRGGVPGALQPHPARQPGP